MINTIFQQSVQLTYVMTTKCVLMAHAFAFLDTSNSTTGAYHKVRSYTDVYCSYHKNPVITPC